MVQVCGNQSNKQYFDSTPNVFILMIVDDDKSKLQQKEFNDQQNRKGNS